jgi:hypothetical protein
MLTLPRQTLIAQRLASHSLADLPGAVAGALAALAGEEWRGLRVAVACGSRGIDRIGLVTRTVVDWLRAQGAEPFLIPGMGSHGGGTPEGQTELLATYGITEASMGVPIEASTETRLLGHTPSQIPVHTSTVALGADAVVLVNRVKAHTDFSSPQVGSGLRKMCAIGLGKVDGAAASHHAASRFGHERVIKEIAAVVTARLPRLYGLALVEDGTHHIARVEAMRGAEFEAREPELFAQSWRWMPALPLSEVDVLIVDQIGKDISGCGMDTNIIGRGVDTAPMANRRTAVRAIYARGLTPGSHGNAVGIGLADIVSTRLVEQMDKAVSYKNALSAMTPATVRVSMNFPTDVQCLQAAFRVAGVEPADARILRIRNTLAIQQLIASDASMAALKGRSDIDVLEGPLPWTLDAHGNLDSATDLLAMSAMAS